LKYSIIGSGFVSSALQIQIDNCRVYDRKNINELGKCDHEIIIISAPTGNRLQVRDDPKKDLLDCEIIIKQVSNANFDRIIHISTVDVFQNNDYGHNRKWLEDRLKSDHRSTIFRLPTLIHPMIAKNILFDLSRKKWLEKISLDSKIQWYPLKNLWHDIKKNIDLGISQNNLVSRPISNRELVSVLEPELLENLSENLTVPCYYDVRSHDGTYWVSDEDIWQDLRACYTEMKKQVH